MAQIFSCSARSNLLGFLLACPVCAAAASLAVGCAEDVGAGHPGSNYTLPPGASPGAGGTGAKQGTGSGAGSPGTGGGSGYRPRIRDPLATRGRSGGTQAAVVYRPLLRKRSSFRAWLSLQAIRRAATTTWSTAATSAMAFPGRGGRRP